MRWWEAAGWLGAVALLASRWHLNLLRSRLLYLLGSVGLLVCALALRAWPLAAGCGVLFGIGAWKLWQLQVRANHRAFQVLEVGPQDEYLRYLLRIHGRDILAHQPGFVWDGAEPGRSAAILQYGPETVGVVLIREGPDGHDDEHRGGHDGGHGSGHDGVARLELDYVTPRYRNIAPGRYLFLESDFFQARGFRRVLTPSGMYAAYYERLGFTPVGDHFEFDLPRR